MVIEQKNIAITDGVCTYAEILNIKHIGPHYHEFGFELVYCLEGTVDLISAYRYRTLHAGDFFMVDLEEIHTLYSDCDNVTMIVHVGFEKDDPAWKDYELCFFNCDSNINNADFETPLQQMSDYMLALACSIFDTDSNNVPAIYYNLRRLILSDFTWIQVSSLTREENAKYKDRLHSILKYIQLHYKEKITISQLSDMFFINENYLSKFLRKTNMLHLSLLVWFCRCYEAEKLLAHTNKKITEISGACGFSSPRYLHKYFKHFYKITPLQYRKRLQRMSEKPDEAIRFTKKASLEIVRRIIVERHCSKSAAHV